MPKPLIIAHRGLPKKFPENTLPSFLGAIEFKPDVVECDYRHSSDGIPFILHDDLLDRTTDSEKVFGRREIAIGELSQAELRRLDAGSYLGEQFAGTKLPTLEETIDAVCPKSKLMIERKDGGAATLVELLRRKNVFDRVVVQAFDWDFIAECHNLEPKITLGVLGTKHLGEERLTKAVAIGATIVGWAERDLTVDAIPAAHHHSLRVWSWTIDDPFRAREFVAAGVDGVITNRCDVIREWLEGSG